MSNVTTTRLIDLSALPFQAILRWQGDSGTVEADVPEADLRAAVDAAPDAPTPGPSAEERIAALEAEVRGMKERAAAATVTGDAAKVRDAVTGPPER